MKKLTLTLCAASLLLFACNNETKSDNKTGGDTTSTAKTGDADKPAVDLCAGQAPMNPADMGMDSAMMATWMANAAAGEMHQMLAKDDGEWTGETTMWMDPTKPPTKSKGIAVNKMVLGGRFQYSEHKGCMGGMPFEGYGFTGYDNAKKKWVGSWVDNMGTTMMIMEGDYDAATKTLKMNGKCTDPMSGKQMTMREELTTVDDNTKKMVMYGPDMTGKEYKMMEIVMTRTKK